MLATCALLAYESVRRSAAARDVVDCLFWQVWAASRTRLHSNDGWKVPSACAAIYARRGAALEVRKLHGCSTRRTPIIFFLAVKPAATKIGKRRTPRHRIVRSFRHQGRCTRSCGASSFAGPLRQKQARGVARRKAPSY